MNVNSPYRHSFINLMCFAVSYSPDVFPYKVSKHHLQILKAKAVPLKFNPIVSIPYIMFNTILKLASNHLVKYVSPLVEL